jgi:regulator of protease activity HflC (stomatin/prohibitin superfamily)
VLLAMALLGTAAAFVGASALGNPVLTDVAVTLGVSVGVLVGVAKAQAARTRPPKGPMGDDAEPSPQAPEEEEPPAAPEIPSSRTGSIVRSRPNRALAWLRDWFRDLGELGTIQVATAAAGLLAVFVEVLSDFSPSAPDAWTAGLGVTACLTAAGLAGTAVHYLAGLDPDRLPEAPGLCRGARVVTWILVVGGAAIGLAWLGQVSVLRIVHLVILTAIAAVCYGLLSAKQPPVKTAPMFPVDLDVLSMLGGRTNVFASILDAGERQLGIDLRSTWALTVVRRSVEPLAIGLCLVGWLSTALSVVGAGEQGLVERLGTPVSGPPLEPGLHMHWPWPVDRVFRIPVRRVQMLTVGHEGQEEGGPEDVLWARQHAANEYTLLLGNGRDLITVDAAVQFRIADPRAWRYHSQNPREMLLAIAYRAVMRTTVNRTLAEALSENVVTTTARMRAMVQEEADALGLGVEVLGFTVGGMHPPVPVALDYQAVVSAELRKVTEVINAQAIRNLTVPAAEAASLTNENAARAQGTEALARASGEAWAFLALQAQYRAAPEEYYFRRRLETLDKNLTGHRFTVVDSRFQRDGGVLWLTP